MAPRIHAFARRLCRSSHDAEEVAQDALARALRYHDAFDPEAGTLDNWLMKTAFRSYLDHRARSAKSPRAMGDAVDAVRAHEVHTAELRDEVTNLLEMLSPVEREVLLHFHRERRTIREIADAMKMPEGTVKSHLHRARARILSRGLARETENES